MIASLAELTKLFILKIIHAYPKLNSPLLMKETGCKKK